MRRHGLICKVAQLLVFDDDIEALPGGAGEVALALLLEPSMDSSVVIDSEFVWRGSLWLRGGHFALDFGNNFAL